MKKQFDVNYYNEHPDVKIVTRTGRNARVICTDLKSDSSYVVIGLISLDDGQEQLLSFNPNGMFYTHGESVNDLFFDLPDPEKKRVPLTYEDLLERLTNNKTMWVNEYVAGSNTLITAFYDTGTICFGEVYDTIDNLMKEGCHFINGDPCWKEEWSDE